MNKAYLLTGGNLGNRVENLVQARDLIAARCGKIANESAFYETAAWGMEDQPAFLNQALCLITDIPPVDLMMELLAIEQEIGRVRDQKYGPRKIDIDMLLYDEEVIDTAELMLPHPQLPHRRFALTPLAEIAPRLVHPLSGKTITRLLKDCKDILPVKKVKTTENLKRKP